MPMKTLFWKVWMTFAELRSLHVAKRVALYGFLVAIAFSLLVMLVSPLVAGLVEEWEQSDATIRARTINESVRDQVAALLRDPASQDDIQLNALFERLTGDKRLAAIAVCGRSGTFRVATEEFPPGLTCEGVEQANEETTAFLELGGRTLLVSAFPLTPQEVGHLVIVHDLTYAQSRAGQASFYALLALGGVIIIATAAAALISVMLLRRWQESMRSTLEDLRAGRASADVPIESMGRELREALEQYDLSRRSTDGIHIDWTPETLRSVLTSELPDTQVIAVSNREPYIHNREGDRVVLQIPASGLVAALEPVMRACNGTWVAHGSGTADGDVVDAGNRIRVPPDTPSYTLRRVWLSDEEQDGYYYGLANEGLWPLCHIAFVRPTFREEDWQVYRQVNEKFADAIAAEARQPDPIILVQDYHFAVLPRLLRQRLPAATIITFWHIPWPNAETFSICPWKEEIVEGLLGSSILGFHTHFHCNNFIETVDRFVESRIDREWRSVVHRGHETLIRPYPISIEWPDSVADKPSADPQAVRRRLGIADGVKFGVGIERFDYTKGILDRIRAIENLFEHFPQWRGKLTFVQAAAPTRSKLGAYQNLQNEAVALVEAINAKYRGYDWTPIVLSVRHHGPDEVAELYRAADFCVVSSLHDGMNLVAKEFVAARDDEAGVLILSTFAGASRELGEALIVNPYHTHEMMEAIHHALTMPLSEQRTRMRQMRAHVRSRNVFRWAGQMLIDAAQLRRQREIRLIANKNLARRGESPGSVVPVTPELLRRHARS
jgi:trehalose 6-phosphate synthase